MGYYNSTAMAALIQSIYSIQQASFIGKSCLQKKKKRKAKSTLLLVKDKSLMEAFSPNSVSGGAGL